MKKRFILNLCMIVVLLLLYNTRLMPLLHEIVGIALFALFGAHIVINRKWNAKPTERTVTILLGIAFAAALVSGIAISHELFPRAVKAPHIWYTVHLLAALAALLLSAAHAIQHRKSLLAALRKQPVVKVLFITLAAGFAVFCAARTGLLLSNSGEKEVTGDKPGMHEGYTGKDGEKKPENTDEKKPQEAK